MFSLNEFKTYEIELEYYTGPVKKRSQFKRVAKKLTVFK